MRSLLVVCAVLAVLAGCGSTDPCGGCKPPRELCEWQPVIQQYQCVAPAPTPEE